MEAARRATGGVTPDQAQSTVGHARVGVHVEGIVVLRVYHRRVSHGWIAADAPHHPFDSRF
jgi:hypothetical protein